MGPSLPKDHGGHHRAGAEGLPGVVVLVKHQHTGNRPPESPKRALSLRDLREGMVGPLISCRKW
jgi:hypothetical protein